MAIYKYYSCGTESEKEGVTLAVNVHDDNGNFMAGVKDIEKHLYKVKEITKEQYDAYLARMKDPNQRGLFGVVNPTGRAKALAFTKGGE